MQQQRFGFYVGKSRVTRIAEQFEQAGFIDVKADEATGIVSIIYHDKIAAARVFEEKHDFNPFDLVDGDDDPVCVEYRSE